MYMRILQKEILKQKKLIVKFVSYYSSFVRNSLVISFYSCFDISYLIIYHSLDLDINRCSLLIIYFMVIF